LGYAEAEIKKIRVPGLPGQKKVVRFHLKEKKLGVVAHACHPSYIRKPKIRGSRSWPKSKTTSQK
jgi:hypothetical protein